MHVMCVHGNLAPTSAAMVLAGDRGRYQDVAVQRDELHSSLKSLFRIAADPLKNKCVHCEIDVETQFIASGAQSSEVGSYPFV